MIKGAIFDMDGTILDSMAIWETLCADYLATQNRTAAPNLKQIVSSMSTIEAAIYLKETYQLPNSIERIMDGINEMVAHFYIHVVQPKAGIPEFLAFLKARQVKMCIATATDLPLAEAALKRNGLYDYFSCIYTCTLVGAGKTKPDIFELALSHLALPKQEVLVLEDATYAVKTAKAAGFQVAGVYDQYERRPEELRALVDFYTVDFCNLYSLF